MANNTTQTTETQCRGRVIVVRETPIELLIDAEPEAERQATAAAAEKLRQYREKQAKLKESK